MNTIKQFLLVVVLFSVLISCKKEEEEILTAILDKENLSAKWLVDDSSTYQSFEFNKSGNYIIIKNTKKSTEAQEILFGTYQINKNTITLSDFGNIEVAEITDNSVRFLIVSDNITINAAKKEEMDSTTRTDLLCKTWKTISIDGVVVTGTNDEFSVIFSAAGTYFVSYTNTNYQFLATWEWDDASETVFIYSYNETSGSAEVTALSANNLEVTEYGEVTVLEPASNTK